MAQRFDRINPGKVPRDFPEPAGGAGLPTRSTFTQRNMARLKKERDAVTRLKKERDAVNMNRKTMEEITGDSTWYSKRPRTGGF